jgi:16S rRNA (guanine(966)-N(2))-methyltransferase RsmD
VIAGTCKGRKLLAPPGLDMRPTSDRLKSVLFSVLSDVSGYVVLDMFAGTGSLGIEALSRGASRAIFVESEFICMSCLQQNLENCGLKNRSMVVKADALHFTAGAPETLGRFDLILADPPYGADLVQRCLEVVSASGKLAPGGILVLEHASDEKPSAAAGGLELVKRKEVGQSTFSLYRNSKDEAES